MTLCALTLALEMFCAGIDLYGDSDIAESYRHGDRYERLDLKRQIEALKIEDKYFESHFYKHEGRGFEEPENKKDAWERIIKFLNRHCENKK